LVWELGKLLKLGSEKKENKYSLISKIIIIACGTAGYGLMLNNSGKGSHSE
jgi:hypothetical protein